MGKREERGFTNQLIRVMLHIIKWLSQPEKRSNSWLISIYSGRKEISKLQNKHPRFNQNFIQTIWNTVFSTAKRKAESEMGKQSDIEELTKKQVFEDEYKLGKDNE